MTWKTTLLIGAALVLLAPTASALPGLSASADAAVATDVASQAATAGAADPLAVDVPVDVSGSLAADVPVEAAGSLSGDLRTPLLDARSVLDTEAVAGGDAVPPLDPADLCAGTAAGATGAASALAQDVSLKGSAQGGLDAACPGSDLADGASSKTGAETALESQQDSDPLEGQPDTGPLAKFGAKLRVLIQGIFG